MKAIDFRNATFNQVLNKMRGKREQVYDALKAYGPCTTEHLSAESGLSLLTLRPRMTELCQLGLAKCVGGKGGEGIYEAVPVEEAKRSFEETKSTMGRQLQLRIGA